MDWFKINMDADSQYAIKVIGRDRKNNSGFTLSHPTISGVFNSDAHYYPYTYDTGGGGDEKAMLLFHSQHTGSSQAYYLSVSAPYSATGSYRIVVAKMEEPEDWTLGHVRGTRGSVTVDGGIEDGSIDFKGDIDYWEFETTAEQKYRIAITVPTGNFLAQNIQGYLFGLYYDHLSYDPGPGARDSASPSLSSLEINGNVIGGRGLSENSGDYADRPYVLGKQIEFDFVAEHSGTHFFGVRTPKNKSALFNDTGPYSVSVTTVSD